MKNWAKSIPRTILLRQLRPPCPHHRIQTFGMCLICVSKHGLNTWLPVSNPWSVYFRTLFTISRSTKVAANHRVLVPWRNKSASSRGSFEERRRLFGARITGNARPVCAKWNAKNITEAPLAHRSPGHCKNFQIVWL